ncbi:hypothetical protein ID866_8554 [Astraeus odoratus]|nr:hypothetical protein ID866_8554 [Astraeus odoratus]
MEHHHHHHPILHPLDFQADNMRLDFESFMVDAGHRLPPPLAPTGMGIKRAPSPSFEGQGDAMGRKRFREDEEASSSSHCGAQGVFDSASCSSLSSFSSSSSLSAATAKYHALVEDLAQELQCGCCAELVYRPVVVSPCQHFFCGSCCVLWIKNGGTCCPACRGVSTHVSSSRPLQAMVDILLRSDPSRTRAEGERMQADEVYKPGQLVRIPSPREASPEPNLNQNSDYARPCPHCASDNQFGWRCPQPVIDYTVDPDRAWHVDEGSPPGHGYCGHCENLLALKAPTTTKCDFCQVSFCGISVHGRCIAMPLNAQQPQDMNDIADFIQSSEIYDCFDNNPVEVDIMFDYLTSRQITPKKIYRDIVLHTQAQPSGFRPLIELDLFAEVRTVASRGDEDPNAPRTRICRQCAAEILLWGLKEWWVRERECAYQKGWLQRRVDCEAGSPCSQQKDLAHAKEFNHLISNMPYATQPPGDGVPIGDDMVPDPGTYIAQGMANISQYDYHSMAGNHHATSASAHASREADVATGQD